MAEHIHVFVEITFHEPILMCIQYKEKYHISLNIFHIGFKNVERDLGKGRKLNVGELKMVNEPQDVTLKHYKA